MRLLVGLLVELIVLAAVAPAEAGVPETWTTWSDDPQEYPAPLPADVQSIRVATTPADIYIEFATYDTPAPPALVTSQVEFTSVQAKQTTVQFVWDAQPHLWIDGKAVTEGWSVSDASTPADWQLEASWTSLGIGLGAPFALRDLQAVAKVGAVPDEATGPDLEFTPAGIGKVTVSVATLEAGATVEGPDFGGGTSVTVDARGEPLVAYYVYDDSRGTERGIYLAQLSGKTLAPQRIGDASLTRDNGRDDQMRTQIANDGSHTFVLFTNDPAVDNDDDGPGHLGTADSVYVLASDNGWTREDPTPGGASDVGAEDVADLAARDGRVVAAVPVGKDVWVVERKAPGQWARMGSLQGANNAKLAIDSHGTVQVAYVVYGTDGSLRDGVLYYASSKDGFVAKHVGDNIEAGWEEPETDGSFAIAVGPHDEVGLLWNDGRATERDQEQKLAILSHGEWSYEFAPLVPGHGNPQYTMRLGYTALGHLVAASGYGGTDTLAVRGPNGGWVKSELPRYDVWDMAVSPAGQVYFAYTQPHGGTTVAISAYAVSPLFAAAHGGSEALPLDASVPAPSVAILGAVLASFGAAVMARRRSDP